MTSRREFFGAGAAILTAVRALSADPLGLPIGCQTYPVRDALGKDFDGTLKQLSDIGYKSIEMCSPKGYEKAGYGPLVAMPVSEMKQKINAAGLKCESSHFQFKEMKENLDERIAWAKDMGLKQMIVSTFGVPQTAGMAEWVKAAQDMNKIAEQVKKAGMQAGFHNHNFEFKEIDGVLVYDKLMSELDPKLVKMQFQVSVISIGYDAAKFMQKYPGRFCSLHLQDWNAAEKKQVAVGQGSVDWKNVFTAAKKGGVKNFFVELNMDQLKESYPYLHELKV